MNERFHFWVSLWPQSCPFKAPCWEACSWLTASHCCPSWLKTTEQLGVPVLGLPSQWRLPLTASLCPGAPHPPSLGFLSATPSEASPRSAFTGVQLHLDLRLSCLLLLLLPLIIPQSASPQIPCTPLVLGSASQRTWMGVPSQ